MRIELLASGTGQPNRRMFAQTLLINATVAIDAGCLGLLSPIEAQHKVQHVFLSHSHLDHVATLPLFLDHVYASTENCPTIYADPSVLESLQRDIFNERVWPDLLRLSQEETQFLRTQALSHLGAIDLEDLTVTPIRLHHVVPTMGFVLSDSEATVGIVADTSPTNDIWHVLRSKSNLRAVFMECSFPNAMQRLAERSGHLTPQTLAAELDKLDRPEAAVIAIHLKPVFHEQIAEELAGLGLPQLAVGRPGMVYTF